MVLKGSDPKWSQDQSSGVNLGLHGDWMLGRVHGINWIKRLLLYPSIYPSIHPSSFLLSHSIFSIPRPPSNRACVPPPRMHQLGVSQPWPPCRRSWGICCGSVWGRWRRSSSGRWLSWRRRRASSTTKRRPTANAPRTLSTPSWRGSPSWRKVSETMGDGEDVGQK